MASYNTNPQMNWPAPIRLQAEAQAMGSGSSGRNGWVPCCTCRVATISFMLYYFTLNVVVLVLVFVNKHKMSEQPQFWWVVSLSGSVVNILMSVFILLSVIFADLSPERANAEPDKTTKPVEDDPSGSQKTVLTINSRPSTIAPSASPQESNAPPVIDQTTAAEAAAAANRTASKATKSPAYFPKLTLNNSNPTQNFQNLTPNSSSVMPAGLTNASKAKKSPKSPTVKARNSNQKGRVRSDPVPDNRAKKKVNKQGVGRKKS